MQHIYRIVWRLQARHTQTENLEKQKVYHEEIAKVFQDEIERRKSILKV